ncbi:MAG TPA: hypothetical protein PLP88_13675 [Bacteroidales bacterium]|nr:hypothetical protein [Bacteroidales bacterium]
MNPKAFRELPRIEQMQFLFDYGNELAGRIYLYFSIRLYSCSGFFVEVWYHQTSNRIDRIIIVEPDDVLKLYENQIKIGEI